MVELMQAGGVPMFFVLIFGVIAFGAAVLFAVRPDARRIDAVQALTRATLFSIGAGIVADIAAVGSKVPANPEWANSPKSISSSWRDSASRWRRACSASRCSRWFGW